MMRRYLSLLLLSLCLFSISTVDSYAEQLQVSGDHEKLEIDDNAKMKKNSQFYQKNGTLVKKEPSLFHEGEFGKALKGCIHTPPTGFNQEQWDRKISSRFTYCMRILLEDMTAFSLKAIRDYMRPAVYVIILFAVVIMGTKAVGGMFRNVKVESAVFVFKIVAVIVAFENMDSITSFFYSVADIILTLIGQGAGKTFTQSTGVGFHCSGGSLPSAGGYVNAKWVSVFDWLDCLIRKLIGLGTTGEVKAGFSAVAAAAFFGGTTAAHAGLFFVSLMFSLGLFLLQVATMMVMAYGAISMLMLMLPLCVLTVFFKVTESYLLKSWLGLVISNIVQPAVMIGFLYFGLAALDTIIYEGSQNRYFKTEVLATKTNSVTEVKTHTVFARKLANGSMVAEGSGAPVNANEYHQVVVPIHQLFDIDVVKDSLAVQAHKISKVVKPGDKLIDFQFNEDSTYYKFFDKQCGDIGFANLATATGTKTLQALKEKIRELAAGSDDPAKMREELEKGLTSAVGSLDYEQAVGALCAAGRSVAKGNSVLISREEFENKVKAFIPAVPVLNMSDTDAPRPGEQLVDVHDRQVSLLIYALAAVTVMAMTFFTYSKHIRGMATRMTGRPGFGLSINTPVVGGKSIAQRIQTGVVRAEDQWTKSIEKKDSAWYERMGGSAFRGFGEGIFS